jgi:hypothetical protein
MSFFVGMRCTFYMDPEEFGKDDVEYKFSHKVFPICLIGMICGFIHALIAFL